MPDRSVMPDLSFLLEPLTETVPNVRHVVVVSGDGLLVSKTDKLSTDEADRLSAICAGLASLTVGAGELCFNGDRGEESLMRFRSGFLVFRITPDGSVLAVVTETEPDMSLLISEMDRLVQALGEHIAPGPRARGEARA